MLMVKRERERGEEKKRIDVSRFLLNMIKAVSTFIFA